jgi:deoxyribodipyrimidine photolyase
MPGMMNKPTPKPIVTKSAAPKPKTKPTPKPSPSTFKQRSAAAEAELKKFMKQGKVTDLNATRTKIFKKYGVRPNGMTR